MMGVYLITNKINGHRYVGCSGNVQRRFMEHKTPRNIANKTTVLSRAFRKHGIENFVFAILERCENHSELVEKEIHWIKTLDPAYNMNSGGDGNPGRKCSAETREKIRQTLRAKWASKTDAEKERFVKNNLSGPKKGHIVGSATRAKLRAANLGKKASKKTRKKMSDSRKMSAIGNQNGNKRVTKINGSKRKTYPSIKAAANDSGIHPSCITKVIKGKQKSAGGFLWELYNSENKRTRHDRT